MSFDGKKRRDRERAARGLQRRIKVAREINESEKERESPQHVTEEKILLAQNARNK